MDKIINAVASKIVNHFIRNNYIPQEKEELYRYGVVVVFQSTVTIITMLLIGLIFGKFFENICFMVVLKLLRNFSGGLHSSKFSTCFLISITANIVVLLLLYVMELSENYLLVLFLEIMSMLVVLMFAPVINENKLIAAKEFRVYKILVVLLSFLFIIASVVLAAKRSNLAFVIGITMTLNSILVVTEEIKNAIARKDDE